MASAPAYAFATLLTSDAYLPGALALAGALRDVHPTPAVPPEVDFQTVCLVTPESVDVSTIKQLRRAYDVVVGVEIIAQEDDKGLKLLGRLDLNTVLTKLHVFRLTQYSKIIFLDADVLPVRPLSHLFTLPHEFSAVPDVGWPDIFNSGVLVLSPGEDKFTQLNELLKSKGTWDGGDQGILNEWRGGDWNRLSFTYNTTPTAAYTYAPAYERFGSQIAAIHFIGPNKPWNSLTFRPPFQNHGIQTESGPLQAYDYNALVDRWFAVYDKYYRAEPAVSENEFEVKRYISAWDEQTGTGSELISGSMMSGTALGLEDLRKIAIQGMPTGGVSAIAPSDSSRPREGEYLRLPLEGRVDLMRPQKQVQEVVEEKVEERVEEKAEKKVEEPQPQQALIRVTCLLQDGKPFRPRVQTKCRTALGFRQFLFPQLRSRMHPDNATPRPRSSTNITNKLRPQPRIHSDNATTRSRSSTHITSKLRLQPRMQSDKATTRPRSSTHITSKLRLQPRMQSDKATTRPRSSINITSSINTTTRNHPNSTMSPLDPPLLLCLFGIQRPIHRQRLNLLHLPFLPKRISLISGISPKRANTIIPKARADPPLLPILMHFSSRPRLQRSPESLRRQGHYRQVTGEEELGVTPSPDRSKVKHVFPWEEKPRQMPGRVFPASDAPSPSQFMSPVVPGTPESVSQPKSQPLSPLYGLPATLTYANAWDSSPVQLQPAFDGDRYRKRNWEDRTEASSMDGDDEDDGDEDDESLDDPNRSRSVPDTDSDRETTKSSTTVRSRGSSISASYSIKGKKKEYTVRGVQTISPKYRSQGTQVASDPPKVSTHEKRSSRHEGRRQWAPSTADAVTVHAGPDLSMTTASPSPVLQQPGSPREFLYASPTTVKPSPEMSTPPPRPAPAAAVERQVSNDGSLTSPPSSIGPISPPDAPLMVSPARKGSRVWDPARGVELFKRGSEEVLARFLKMGSWEDEGAQ
ncbi:hypothetical protein MVEN_01524400 [Mycena venus]|uniref:glycogenin glucosyltransferase n=1 Tax=Mycena venus TaxID=2733690 RepID=A0A8H6XT79_9AGAR|nr:hypothetical protein MVEN_01524400 [Mycena venus]